MRVLYAVLFLTLALSSDIQAKTEVVSASKDGFPNSQDITVYVAGDRTYLECIDQYAQIDQKTVDPDELLVTLEKLLKWMQLNQQVKAYVEKRVPNSPGIVFYGLESGSSFALVSVGSAMCSAYESQIKTLVDGLRNNLENARVEDAKNKAALFD